MIVTAGKLLENVRVGDQVTVKGDKHATGRWPVTAYWQRPTASALAPRDRTVPHGSLCTVVGMPTCVRGGKSTFAANLDAVPVIVAGETAVCFIFSRDLTLRVTELADTRPKRVWKPAPL